MEEHRIESKSHVKVWVTAKGEPQWEVKVVTGDNRIDIQAAEAIALDSFKSIKAALT